MSHTTKLRHLRVLQLLSQYAPMPIGERYILSNLTNDRELEPTLEKVRDSIDYLEHHYLVEVVEVSHVQWMAAFITDSGQQWLQSDEDHDLNIYNPNYQPPELPKNYNGRTSKITKLPSDIRAWIDQQLIERSFTDYSGLTQMLNERGLDITRSSLGRYAKKLKARVAKYKEKAEMVKSLAGVFEDDAASVMQGAFGVGVTAVIDAIEGGEYSESNDSLAGLVKALPALGKGFHDAEKHKIEQSARRKAREEAKNEGSQIIQSMGLDDTQLRVWKERFLIGGG